MGINMILGELVAGLLLLSLLGWFWRGRGVRELALQYAQARCRSELLQLLDAHVAFAGWRWLICADGRRRLVRRYDFEFSATGVERCNAWLAMYGRRLVRMELSPYPVPAGAEESLNGAFRQISADD